MTRTLGRDHDHADILWRHNILKMNIESVTESQRLPRFQIRGDLFFIDLRLNLIRKGHDDQDACADAWNRFFHPEQY